MNFFKEFIIIYPKLLISYRLPFFQILNDKLLNHI